MIRPSSVTVPSAGEGELAAIRGNLHLSSTAAAGRADALVPLPTPAREEVPEEERRIDTDGVAYTRADFEEFYGAEFEYEWERAAGSGPAAPLGTRATASMSLPELKAIVDKHKLHSQVNTTVAGRPSTSFKQILASDINQALGM